MKLSNLPLKLQAYECYMNAKLEPKIIWIGECVSNSEEHSLFHKYINKQHFRFFLMEYLTWSLKTKYF